MQSICGDCKLRSLWNRNYFCLPMDVSACNRRVNIRDFRNVRYLNEGLISNDLIPKIGTTNGGVHSESLIENAVDEFVSSFFLTQ